MLTKAAGKALAEALVANSVLTELDLSSNFYGDGVSVFGPGFAQELAAGLNANGAMTSLHIGNNNIPVDTMNEIIAVVEAKPAMKVLCGVPFRDKTIIELDASSQSLGVEGALVISRYLENNGALETITFGDEKAVTMEINMTEADLSGKELGASGAIIVAAFVPKCQ